MYRYLIFATIFANICWSNTFFAGPICNETKLIEVDSSLNALPIIQINDLNRELQPGNYHFQESDLTKKKFVKVVNDSNNFNFSIEKDTPLYLIKDWNGDWVSRMLHASDRTSIVFLTDSLPQFCRPQTIEELELRGQKNTNLFLTILLVPIVALTGLLLL